MNQRLGAFECAEGVDRTSVELDGDIAGLQFGEVDQRLDLKALADFVVAVAAGVDADDADAGPFLPQALLGVGELDGSLQSILGQDNAAIQSANVTFRRIR